MAGRTAIVSESDSELVKIRRLFTFSVVWGARTWAVCGRNHYVLGFFGSVGLAVIILDAVSTAIVDAPGVTLNTRSPVSDPGTIHLVQIEQSHPHVSRIWVFSGSTD